MVLLETENQLMYRNLLGVLNSYKFEGFVHYTNFENLRSILKSGYLYSRNEVSNRHLSFEDYAEPAVIEGTNNVVKNYTRFFYYYNTPASFNFEMHAKRENTEMVVLLFKKDLAYCSDALWYEKSAARDSYSIPSSDPEKALTYSWSRIFERGPLPYDYTIKAMKKRYRNAEFDYPSPVSLNMLEAIYFKSEKTLNEAIRRFGYNSKFKLDREKKRFANI